MKAPTAVRTQATRVAPKSFPGAWLAYLACALLLIAVAQSTCAAPPKSKPHKPDKLFASADPLVLTITAPWRDLVHDKKGPASYRATLEYTDEAGSKHDLALAVEHRGLTRLRLCDFPPIRLRFAKGVAKGSVFRGSKSLKLATHCKNGERSEEYYVKEMLAYRIYNLMTDLSFRVRPVSITYFDSKQASADGPHFGFLIEDDGALAKRNGLKKLRVPGAELGKLDSLAINRFALFEYLIGNTDWAVLNGPSPDHCCHNSVLLGPNPQGTIYAVPYDFDSSGLVDASYAVPNASLKIRNVTQRVFRGFCAKNATLEAARREYLEREPQILDVVRNESRLSPRTGENAHAYLSTFFEILRDDEKFAKDIKEKCRK
ncbi:MAG: hypothetical protein WBV61_06370 [Rhodanobacteraceae bacterium]